MKPNHINKPELNTERCKISQIWKSYLKDSFNVVYVDKIFRQGDKSLVVGHEDGVVRSYRIPSPDNQDSSNTYLESSVALETKGGPIQTLAIHDVTKLNNNDITVADSRGMVTVFSNGQILTRKSVSEHCIQCLRIQKDPLGQSAIIVGDTEGHVAAFSPFCEFWRLRLTDAAQYKALTLVPHITCIHVTDLTDSHGQHRNYVLVADSCKYIHLVQEGTIVQTLSTPAVVTAMSSGTFVDPEDIAPDEPGNKNGLDVQVALATETGAIYIMANFQVYQEEFCNIHQTITSLHTLEAADSQGTDTLLCAGHFDALCVLRNGKEISRYKTPNWINSITTTDLNDDGVKELVIGCHDNSIHGLHIQFS